MSVRHLTLKGPGLPDETMLLDEVRVRLLEPSKRDRYDQLIEQRHYLGNANSIGQVLRYVAEYRGEWVALLTFCSSALHLKPRDRFLNWSAKEVGARRHLVAQNSRYLMLPSTGKRPTLLREFSSCGGRIESGGEPAV